MKPAFEKTAASMSVRRVSSPRQRTHSSAIAISARCPSEAMTNAMPSPPSMAPSNGRWKQSTTTHGVTTNIRRFTMPPTAASSSIRSRRSAAPTPIITKRTATCCATSSRFSISRTAP